MYVVHLDFIMGCDNHTVITTLSYCSLLIMLPHDSLISLVILLLVIPCDPGDTFFCSVCPQLDPLLPAPAHREPLFLAQVLHQQPRCCSLHPWHKVAFRRGVLTESLRPGQRPPCVLRLTLMTKTTCLWDHELKPGGPRRSKYSLPSSDSQSKIQEESCVIELPF